MEPDFSKGGRFGPILEKAYRQHEQARRARADGPEPDANGEEIPFATAAYVLKKPMPGYQHWEFVRLTGPNRKPDFFRHRDRNTNGNWIHGLPEGITGRDLRPASEGDAAELDLPAEATGQHLLAVLENEGGDTTQSSSVESADNFILRVIHDAGTGPTDQVPDEKDLCDFLATGHSSVTRALRECQPVLTDVCEFDRFTTWVTLQTVDDLGQPTNSLVASTVISSDKSNPPLAALGLDFEGVHSLWLHREKPRPRHPLIPLIKAWQQWRRFRGNKGRNSRPWGSSKQAILSQSLRHARQGKLLPLGHEQPLGELAKSTDAYLPGMEPPKSAIVPVLPLAVYDEAGGRESGRGQGAPIPQRLFWECLMEVNRGDRKRKQDVLFEPTLRDILGLIWPNGWQRGRDLPRLIAALRKLDAMRILWERREWRLVAVDALPRPDTELDDVIPLRVIHLPNSHHGPLIHRAALRKIGLQSAPAWRSYLRLAYIWDKAKSDNKGKRVYAGDPSQHLVPELNLHDLAALGYDEKTDGKNRKDRAKSTRKSLTKMAEDGFVVIEMHNSTEGWRIMEQQP